MRVSDADPEMLRYLSERGISPGDRLLVRERQPFGGPLLVSFDDGPLRAGDRRAPGARDARAGRSASRPPSACAARAIVARAPATRRRPRGRGAPRQADRAGGAGREGVSA